MQHRLGEAFNKGIRGDQDEDGSYRDLNASMKQTNAKLVWAPDHNTQHNDVNRQLYHAVSAVATAPVHLGDKHQKRQRTATTPRVNPVLDAYNGQGNHQCDIGTSGGLNQQGTATIIDTKVGSPYTHLTDPIATHGGTHAGGATEHRFLALSLGNDARSDGSGTKFDYKTGRGDLGANRGTPNGKPHYQHATHVLRHEVIIAIAEAGTGAILKDLHELLLRLEERSNPATDTTHYGNSRISATSFYQHYARHIGAAVQDAFGVEMLRVEACLGQAWLKRQRVLRDPGLIDDPRPPPKRREPSA